MASRGTGKWPRVHVWMTREERIKCKRKQGLLFKELGNTLCFPSFPSWGGRLPEDKRSGGSIESRTPCLLPGDLLGWVSLGRMPETGDTGCSAGAPAHARACPEELDISKQKTIQTLQPVGFPWQPRAPGWLHIPPPPGLNFPFDHFGEVQSG